MSSPVNPQFGGAGTGARAGTVYLVGAGPGDPGLLTMRGAELLASADVVLHDELVHPALLQLAKSAADVRSVGKRGGDIVSKQASQAGIEAELLACARAAKSVVRLKGGDPFLFGRGSEEAEALAQAGIPFEIVPGVPSPLGAAAYAGISLTHRDLASSVTFVSGTTRAGVEYDWSELASVRGTVCVLMGMRRLEEVAAQLISAARRAPETPVAVVQWGTRSEQRTVLGTLGDIAPRARDAGLSSPAIVIVGQVALLRRALRWFDTRPLFGKRVVVLRAKHQAGATSALLRRRGAEPVEFASIEILPAPDPARVERAIRELATYDLVAFTSDNGVARFFDALDAAGRDTRAFGAARIAAVGPATAAALLARGVRADLVPQASFRGEALADVLLGQGGDATPKRILLPRALVAREALPETLRARGAEVDVVAVYETRKVAGESRDAILERLRGRRVDAVLFTSASTAESFAECLAEEAKELLDGVVVASIGPATSEAARARGVVVAVEAGRSTTYGVIDALEEYFSAETRSKGPAGV